MAKLKEVYFIDQKTKFFGYIFCNELMKMANELAEYISSQFITRRRFKHFTDKVYATS